MRRVQDWLERRPTMARSSTIPLTAAAFWALHSWHVIADVQLWLLYLILGVSGITSFLAESRWPAECTTRQLHFRVAVDVATTTAVIYATGWGPTLAIGYVFIVANEYRKHGSRVWQPALIWTTLGVGVGELAIATGVAPTLISEPEVHGLAVLTLLGIVFAIR